MMMSMMMMIMIDALALIETNSPNYQQMFFLPGLSCGEPNNYISVHISSHFWWWVSFSKGIWFIVQTHVSFSGVFCLSFTPFIPAFHPSPSLPLQERYSESELRKALSDSITERKIDAMKSHGPKSDGWPWFNMIFTTVLLYAIYDVYIYTHIYTYRYPQDDMGMLITNRWHWLGIWRCMFYLRTSGCLLN